MRTWVIIPDLHYPFHDPKYIRVATKIISLVKPFGIVQLGDALDFYQLSTFDKDPSRITLVTDDLDAYRRQVVTWMSYLPRNGMYYQLEGNHEYRLQRYVNKNAAAVAPLVRSVQESLGLNQKSSAPLPRDHKWFSYHKWDACQIGDCHIFHGHFYSKHVAAQCLERYPGSSLFGHTHRVQYLTNGNRFSCSLGHGSLESQTMHLPVPSTWQQALGILHEYEGKTSLEIVLIHKGKANFRGKELQG